MQLMWLKVSKKWWLVLSLICIGMAFLFSALERGGTVAGSRPLTHERGESASITQVLVLDDTDHKDHKTALRREDPVVATKITANPGTLIVRAKTPAHGPAEGWPLRKKTSSLGPDSNHVGVYYGHINRAPVDIGEYLDPDSEPINTINREGKEIADSPVSVGAYISPDSGHHQPLTSQGRDANSAQVNAGHHLDPGSERYETFSTDQTTGKDVGPFLNADN